MLALPSLGAAMKLDGFLSRGIETGVHGASPANGALLLGMNVFLEKEPDREKVRRSVTMLRESRVTFVRQTFSWAEIEPAAGEYYDRAIGVDSWAKYDFIVEQLHNAGIRILARVDTVPRWARPPDDDVERWDKGPPQDFQNYANFVGVLAERYKGRIQHFQVWNEPNLTGEWGGKPISPEQYGLLLRLTRTQLRAHHPDALLVTAGFAQTIEDGRATNNLSELDFIQRLYDAGYGDSFDILAVMAYGLGHSPEDRRVGPQETNFSRLQLVREVMVRNGDAAKPIWAAEYGWVAFPDDWQGSRRTSWGEGVDEQTQAQWTIAGLERARREWPWLGAVFVWGFRWVEAPAAHHPDPARYFEVVRHDFTPRPVYWALQSWASRQDIAMAGPLPLGDRLLTWQGPWRDEERDGRLYRVTATPDAAVHLVFQGTDIQALLGTGPDQGTLYVAIDGRPVAGLPTDDGGSYIRLNGRNTAAVEFALAAHLPPGDHHVVLRSGGTGEVAIGAITVGSRRPFAWVLPLFIAGDLMVLVATLFLSARVCPFRHGMELRDM